MTLCHDTGLWGGGGGFIPPLISIPAPQRDTPTLVAIRGCFLPVSPRSEPQAHFAEGLQANDCSRPLKHDKHRGRSPVGLALADRLRGTRLGGPPAADG